MLDDAKKERLEELRQARFKREQAEKDANDERELAAEELHHQLAADTSGVRGVDFEIVNNPFGVFALRKPDDQAIQNWDRATNTKKTIELDWQIGLLKNYILPDKARGLEWARLAAERPGLVWDTANAFLVMMGVARDEVTKKS